MEAIILKNIETRTACFLPTDKVFPKRKEMRQLYTLTFDLFTEIHLQYKTPNIEKSFK